jgi:S1-C subfamily serine protease
VVKDDLLSFHWYQLAFQNYRAAAEKGDGSVMGNLVLGYVADMYAEGHGVRKNGAEAVKWYRRAYEQGKISSPASALACLYDNGDCVPKNDIEALAWAYLAKASGDSFMANYLENKLGPQNSLIAQQRSKELQAELDKEKEAQSNEPKSPFGDTPLDNVQNQPKASGSGVFISADGLFLTAAHVIENSTFLRVVTQKGAIKATIVQVDRANDVALLKCEGTFVPVQIKSSSSLKLGQTVFTLGFPDIQIQGFSPKMTKGEISSLLGVQDDPRQWQISVPVQPGNSGGPLFDEQSNLVGLIEAKLDAVAMAKETGDVPQNVNYALKSAYLMPMLDPYTSELPKAGVPPAVPQKIEDVVSQATPSIGLVLVY